ncbi:ligninase h2 precursor [Colletotrichum truncatum]|uniref:Ligninase h2 n=1 Tax=Colletotrichum truncatum TaxID=5467 RepID=A0ACC3Z668_COLTU|nr:ligninase h2 precursor [Colletotrichum truncatum]KAF6787111.1 ligninase h2 precursor [Colletotrichum truncatum]
MYRATLLLAAFAATSSAYPGWSNVDFLSQLHSRAESVSNEPLGDLANLGDSSLSPVGKDIKNILTTTASALSDDKYGDNVPALGSKECSDDKCCVWKHVGDELAAMFRDENGCTDPARAAIRLGFHDAAGWSKATGPLGGADGSIVLAAEEIERPANNGLEEIVGQMKVWFEKYKGNGVGMADLIQFAANTGTVMCPKGPRIKTLVGRKDSSVAAPDGLLPDVNDPAEKLIGLFVNKTISPPGLAALVGAHSTSKQRFVDQSRANAPQDSTPGVWDTLFYSQTLSGAPSEVFTFNSDIALSKDAATAPAFKVFAENQLGWNAAFAREYLRLSLLGVDNINELTDCTKALPASN